MDDEMNNIIMKEAGKRIHNRRKELGMKLQTIKEKCGISVGSMSEIENGNRVPTMHTLIKLSQILDCSIDWIATGTEQSSQISSPIELSQEEIQMIEYLRGMNADEREDLLEYTKMRHERLKRDVPKLSNSPVGHVDTA